MSKFIISRAHNVVQSLPLADKQYVCVTCGLRGDLAKLFGSERCTPTMYLASSGWRDESTLDERAQIDRIHRK